MLVATRSLGECAHTDCFCVLVLKYEDKFIVENVSLSYTFRFNTSESLW